jgi:RHS repeat-associated protein
MICDQTPETIYDSGTVFITVNGHEYDHFYPLNANGDSSVEVAAGLVNAIQADPARVVNASLSGSVVILTAVNAGSAGNNIAFSSGSSYDTADFSVPSFTPSPASGHLAGGQDAVTGGTDAGTVSISVGGFTGTVCYGISTNPFCSGKPHYDNATAIASALVGTFGNSGATVHGSASAGIIQMTYNVVGMVGNTGVAINSTPDNASTFPGGSFSGFITLSGGQDPAPAGLAHPFITTYTYDAANNTTLISQAAGYVSGQLMPGQQRSFVHDGLGRLTSSTTPESGTVQQFYTPLAGFICGTGNPMLVCRTQDARGVVKNLSYDGINRLVGMQFTNTTGGPDPLGTPPVSYQYDAGGAAAFALDRITKITEGPATPTPVNSHTFTYDNWGRILTDTQSIDQKTYVVRYAYNLAGRISSITYPSGRVVLQNFDAIGRPCAVGASGSTCTTGTRYLNSLTYNAAGETLSFALGNGVQASFTYNDHLQLSTLRYFKGSSEILNLAYDYTTGVTGDNGQIQKMHYYTTPGVEDLTKSENFQYDNLGRLSAAQTGVVNSTAGAKTWSLTWSYDRFGNRTTQTMIGGDPTLPVAQPSLLFDPATNRITNSGYTYDAAGNMTHDATAAYTYDGANRLTKINTTAAVYSYFGPQRIKKVLGSTTTRYIYAGLVPIAEYVNGATTPSTEYIYSGSRLLVTISGSATTYHHPDHVSNRAETNSSGTKIRSAGNLPWGDPWYELTGTDKWKFSNYEHDSGAGETGLDYAGSRYYSSSLGRFLSPDRIPGRLHSPRSLNAYLYVGDDPVNISDPMGDFWFEQTFCVNTGSGDVCETEFQWIDLDEGGGGGGGFDPGGGDGGGGGGGGDDGNKNNQPTPQCTFVIGINNLAGLSDDVLKQLEAKIASLFGPSVGVTFVDGAGGQPGEGNFSGHVEGPGPSAPKADYQLNLTTSGFYWGSWFGNYGSTPGVIIHYGTPDVYTDTIRKEWPTDYADVFGISGAHELIHRITNWGDVSYNNNEPNDIMAINSNPNGLNPKTVALTDKEKAALLNDCLDKHK